MTSANVTEYDIRKGDVYVGHHSENAMCKSHFEKLLKYEPLKEHTIYPYGYDEEEELWEDEPINLYDFLKGMVRFNKTIKEYFEKL